MFKWFYHTFSLTTSLSNDAFISGIKKYRDENHMVQNEFYFVNHQKGSDSIFRWDVIFPDTRGFQTTIEFEFRDNIREGIYDQAAIHVRIRLSKLIKALLIVSACVMSAILLIVALFSSYNYKEPFLIITPIVLSLVFVGMILHMRYQMQIIEEGLRYILE